MTSNDDVTTETVHTSHRTRRSDATSFNEVCELCGSTGDGGPLGGLVNPCSASDEARRQYDTRANRRNGLSQERVLVELDFVEVKEEMFAAFIEQVEKCSSTFLGLGLIVHVFGRREYVGGIRYAIAVTMPKYRAENTTLTIIRRWFEDGTW